ncbi:MAG: PAS domain S-box protein, partial [bacterium]|nr:PAS domain S-box protein [bacterium]
MTTELPVRILLVDDDEIDREAIRRHISRERLPFALTTASSEADALEALKKEIFDVVLLDYDLRISTGLDILPHVSSIPVIFITGSGSEEIAVEAMRRGAKDYLIKDPDRNYLTVLPLTISNVLEHRDSEKNLRESEARFRALTEKASDLVLIVNRDREMTYTSPSIRRLGFSAGEILGKKPRDFVHPDDLHFVLAALTETMQKPYKAVRMHEVRVKQKNGAWVWFEGLVTNMFEQPGINGIVFNGRDVSERKVIEEALYQSEERLKATLASISDLVFGLDDKGIFIDYHPPLDHKELYAPPEMFLGNPYKEVLPEHISTKLEKAIEEATASGAVRKIEYPLVVKGTSKWYEAKVTVRRNSHGKLKGVTVVVVDITERKMAREALKKAHDQLEQRVAERTKELIATNKKLLKEI